MITVKYLCACIDTYVWIRRLVPWLAEKELRHGLAAGCELLAKLAQTSQCRSVWPVGSQYPIG